MGKCETSRLPKSIDALDCTAHLTPRHRCVLHKSQGTNQRLPHICCPHGPLPLKPERCCEVHSTTLYWQMTEHGDTCTYTTPHNRGHMEIHTILCHVMWDVPCKLNLIIRHYRTVPRWLWYLLYICISLSAYTVSTYSSL